MRSRGSNRGCRARQETATQDTPLTGTGGISCSPVPAGLRITSPASRPHRAGCPVSVSGPGNHGRAAREHGHGFLEDAFCDRQSPVPLPPVSSPVILRLPLPPVEYQPQLPEYNLRSIGIGIRNLPLFRDPAGGETQNKRCLPVLIANPDAFRSPVLREQGAPARCRAITTDHTDPLFKPAIEGYPPAGGDGERGSLSFWPGGGRRAALSCCGGLFRSAGGGETSAKTAAGRSSGESGTGIFGRERKAGTLGFPCPHTVMQDDEDIVRGSQVSHAVTEAYSVFGFGGPHRRHMFRYMTW